MSTAAGKHLYSWKGITVPLVALLTYVPPIQPSSPSPQPIHHTQNASHRPSSSPAGRRKIDLFVYVCKEGLNEQGGARGGKKGKDKGMSRGGLLPRYVFTKDSHQQSVRRADGQAHRRRVYFPVGFTHPSQPVYLSNSTHLISTQCDRNSKCTGILSIAPQESFYFDTGWMD